MKNVWFYVSCIALILGTVIALVVMNNMRQRKKQVAENDEASSVKEDKPPGKDWVKQGGVWRKRADVVVPKDQQEKRDAARSETATSQLPNPGKTPPIKMDLNPNVKSVAEALKQTAKDREKNDLSYRLSSFVKAPDFDREKYLADKQAYLDEVVPGRIWQELAAGPGVPQIRRRGKYYKEILQGETIILRAATEPGMPVSFMSPKLGEFDNSLPNITVAANKDGIAEARFKANSGTHGEIDIIATSPVRSGRARYLVKVVLPEQNQVDGTKASENISESAGVSN